MTVVQTEGLGFGLQPTLTQQSLDGWRCPLNKGILSLMIAMVEFLDDPT